MVPIWILSRSDMQDFPILQPVLAISPTLSRKLQNLVPVCRPPRTESRADTCDMLSIYVQRIGKVRHLAMFT